MAGFAKYRIRFCCNDCAKWDVLEHPVPYLVHRFSSWSEAFALVQNTQREQIRNARRT